MKRTSHQPAAAADHARLSAADAIYARMCARWGELIGPTALFKELGYPNAAALASARRRGQVNVPTFRIEGRRGYFAKTRDVAVWLAQLGLVGSAGTGKDAGGAS